jgi:hypothetical protein
MKSKLFEAVLREVSLVDWDSVWGDIAKRCDVSIPETLKQTLRNALRSGEWKQGQGLNEEAFKQYLYDFELDPDNYIDELNEEALDDIVSMAFEIYKSDKYRKYIGERPPRPAARTVGGRGDHYARERNRTAATGNKWAIENFNATH